jgi:two-component system sensor histidine kinase AgrC
VFVSFFTRYLVKKEIQVRELEQQKIYNDTMNTLLNELRGFKHGYENTIAVIKGLVEFNRITELNAFLDETVSALNQVSVVNTLMFQKIKNAALAGLIVSKFEAMKEKGINAKLAINEEIIETRMKTGDLCECVGILIDNAIEAAFETEEKIVKLSIDTADGVILCIENSFQGDKPDLMKIFEKEWSTKGANRGMGLWILKNRVKKYKNVILNTSTDNNYFKQKLIIS